MKVSEGSVSTPAPQGTHVCRCFAVIDLGTQTSEFQGESYSKRKVLLGFEIPDETHVFDEKKGPEPFTIWSRFTASLHPQGALRPVLEAWRGKAFTKEEARGFDMKNLLGAPAMVTVTHNDRGYANIQALVKLPKSMQCKPAVNATKYLSLEPNEFNAKDYGSLSDRLKDTIAKSPEYKRLFQQPEEGETPASAPATLPPGEDDVPF